MFAALGAAGFTTATYVWFVDGSISDAPFFAKWIESAPDIVGVNVTLCVPRVPTTACDCELNVTPETGTEVVAPSSSFVIFSVSVPEDTSFASYRTFPYLSVNCSAIEESFPATNGPTVPPVTPSRAADAAGARPNATSPATTVNVTFFFAPASCRLAT